MFDFAWSEIALIGIVALVAIGPKDLPVAIKTVAALIKKARRMAGEFQVHVDEMVREADLQDVRREFNDLRRMDIKGKILSAVDSDGALRKTMAENPLASSTALTPPPAEPEHSIAKPDVMPPAAEPAVPAGAAPTVPMATVLEPTASAPTVPVPTVLVPTLPALAVPEPAAAAVAAHPAPDAVPPISPPADAKQPSLHG